MLVPLDEVVFFDVITNDPISGAVSDADSTPTFDVYEEATDTGLLGATNLTKRTALTGNYRGTFTASAANGFEVGKWYSVVASATVNNVLGKTVALGFFLLASEASAGVLEARAQAIATDALDAAALATSAVNEIQAGLATQALLTTVAGYVDTEITDIQNRLPAALVGGRMDSSVGAVAAGVIAGAAFAADAFDAIFTRALSAVEGAAGSRSLAWAIAKLTNRVYLSGSTLHVTKTDDSTDVFSQAVNTDAGQAPVVSVDTN